MAIGQCRECGKDVSTEAASCPHCGAPNPVASAAAEPEKKQEIGFVAGCLMVVMLFVIVVIFAAMCAESGDNTPEPEHSNTMAYVMCQEFVSRQLRAPSTADYPWMSADGVSSLHQGEGRYMVRGYVDAQNAFGATIRTNWTCDVQYTGGDNWRALDVQLLE